MVFEDVYFPGHICYPANAALDRFVELYQAVARAKEGGDVAIGVRLLGMALEAGLVEVRVGLVVPTFRDGEGKQVARVTMEHIRGRWLALGWHPIPRWIMSSASWAGSPTTTGR